MGWFFSSSDFLYPILKNILQPFRARPYFDKASENPYVSLGIVDCSLYTCCFVPKDDDHTKRSYACIYSCGILFLGDSSKVFHHSCQTKSIPHWIRSLQTSSSSDCDCNEYKFSFIGSYTENQFWCQLFGFRQIKVLRRGQPIVDFDAAHVCCLHFMKKKAMNSQDEIHSISFQIYKEHYVLVFNLTLMHNATENYEYPELVRETLRLILNFTIFLEGGTELLYSKKECLWL